jgi:hypothetical protein
MAADAEEAAEDTRELCYSFEEFRMMYDSTELISERKITFNRNNASLCLAIIAGQALAANWCYKKQELMVAGPLFVCAIAILAIVFCIYWDGQLWTFKELNAAKFKVLEEMAGRVVFPDYKERSVRSMSPFDREYQIMNERSKLVQSRKGLMLPRSSLAETIVPKGFIAFFGCSILLSVFWLLVNLHIVAP